MPTEFVYFDPEGLNPDALTEAAEVFNVNATGRFLLLRVTNTTGRVTVMAAEVQVTRETGATGQRVAKQ